MIVTRYHTNTSLAPTAVSPSTHVPANKISVSDNFNPTLIVVNSLASDASSAAGASEYSPQPLDRLDKSDGALSVSTKSPVVASTVTPSGSLPRTCALPPKTTKLDEEPNPFEQSFSSSRAISRDARLVLPPLAAIENPGARIPMDDLKSTGNNNIPRKDEIVWNSFRPSPLPPSLMMGPTGQQHEQGKRLPVARDVISSLTTISTSTSSSLPSNSSSIASPFSHPGFQQSNALVKYDLEPQHHHDPANHALALSTISSLRAAETESESRSNYIPADTNTITPSEHRTSSRLVFAKRVNSVSATNIFYGRSGPRRQLQNRTGSDEEEKRKNFLERNRRAALKCRQRKKQWVHDLQARIEFLTADNEKLQTEVTALREQLLDMKSLLLEHKTCPINAYATTDALGHLIPDMASRSTARSPHHEGSMPPSAATPPPIRHAPYSWFSSVDDDRRYYHYPPSPATNSTSN